MSTNPSFRILNAALALLVLLTVGALGFLASRQSTEQRGIGTPSTVRPFTQAMRRGRAATDRGDFRTAEDALEEALADRPDSMTARLALARLYEVSGRGPEAWQGYRTLVADSEEGDPPGGVDTLVRYGDLGVAYGHPDEARRVFARVIRMGIAPPGGGGGMVVMGTALEAAAQRRFYDLTVRTERQTTSVLSRTIRDPRTPLAALRAAAHIAAGRLHGSPEKAALQYRLVIAAEPQDWLARCHLAVLLARKRGNEARTLLREATTRGGANVRPWLERVELLANGSPSERGLSDRDGAEEMRPMRRNAPLPTIP